MKKSALIFILLFAVAENAQNNSPISLIHGSRFYTGIHLELWNYLRTNTFEAVVPLYYSMDLDATVKGLAFDLVTSPTLAVHGGAGSADIGNLFSVANTKTRLSYNIFQIILVTAGLQVPTGSNRLSSSQRNTAGVLATSQMDFKVARTMTGVDGDFTAATGIKISDELVLGAAVGYLLHGSYKTDEFDSRFNPGDELTLTAGIDYEIVNASSKMQLTGDFMWTRYGADKVEKTEVFRAGKRISINGRFSLKSTSGTENLTSLSLAINTKNVRIEQGLDTLMRPISVEYAFDVSDSYRLRNTFYFKAAEKSRPYLISKINFFSPNGNSLGRALICGAGAGLSYQMSRPVNFTGHALLEIGSMDKSVISGVELGGGIQYVF